MTAIEPPFTQHWSWHLNQRKPFSFELDQFSIRINFTIQFIAVFKKRNYFMWKKESLSKYNLNAIL